MLSLFAAQLVLAGAILPPWQNPDEPQHFALARGLAKQTALNLANRRDLEVEAEILASMARHGWWEAYDEDVPSPLPTNFDQAPAHLSEASRRSPLWYLGAAALVRALGLSDLMSQYYALRIVSALTTLAVGWLVLSANRIWFGDRAAVVGAAVLALQPQVALIGISVGPDPFVFLCSAVVWWQGARWFAGAGTAGPLSWMLVATIAGVFAKQIAAPLALQGPVVGLVGAARRFRARSLAPWTVAMIAGAAVVLPAALLIGAWAGVPVLWWYWLYISAVLTNHVRLDAFAPFTSNLLTSAYLSAGWLRFTAPPEVVLPAVAISALGALRAAALLLRRDPRRAAILAAVLFVAIQLAAIYGTGIGAQGRFLFPAASPFAGLCGVGLLQWRSERLRTIVPCAAIGILGSLAAYSWLTVVVAAYAR